MANDFINIQECSQLMGLAKNTLYSYLSRGTITIPTYHFGRFLRFKRGEVLNYIEANTIKAN